MHVSITGRHFEVTPSLKEHTNKKITRLNKYIAESSNAHIILYVEKYRHYAEININYNGTRLHSKEQTADMYTSIDKAINKIEHQIKKIKDKIHKKKHTAQPAFEEDDSAPLYDKQTDIKISKDNSVKPSLAAQITSKPIKLQSMSREDAAVLSKKKGYGFFFFMNSATQKANVLYPAEGDSFIILEPSE